MTLFLGFAFVPSGYPSAEHPTRTSAESGVPGMHSIGGIGPKSFGSIVPWA